MFAKVKLRIVKPLKILCIGATKDPHQLLRLCVHPSLLVMAKARLRCSYNKLNPWLWKATILVFWMQLRLFESKSSKALIHERYSSIS